RSKIKKAFESGAYSHSIEVDEMLMVQWRGVKLVQPSTPIECSIQEVFAEVFGVSLSEIGIHTNIYDIGCSSLEIFRLKWLIQNKLGLPNIAITTIISNPTIQSLAQALDPGSRGSTLQEYNPVVVLRSEGKNNPLWLIHP